MIETNQQLQKRLDAITPKDAHNIKIIMLGDDVEQSIIDSGHSIEALRRCAMIYMILGVDPDDIAGRHDINVQAFEALIA